LGKQAGDFSGAQIDMIKQAGQLIQDLHASAAEMEAVHDKAESAKDALATAKLFADEVVPSMDKVADICGKLESLVDDGEWPLPKFSELLFTR
jgi:glutamine synthetase